MKRIFTRPATGFSLMEVLVALALMGVVTTAVFKTWMNQHEAYMTQEDISTIQHSARASIDELTRQIRIAGNGLPNGIDPVIASNTDPDTITIRYVRNDCQTFLSEDMPQPSAELKCDDVSCFEDGQWVYIFEPDSGVGEWLELTQVQNGSNHLQHNTTTLSRSYGENSLVLGMAELKFFVDETSDPDHPRLLVDIMGQGALIYADNISDLQFRYRLSNGLVDDDPLLMTDVREVLIAITGRSAFPIAGDTSETFRTRTYQSSATLRNVM